jgi:hypothetical protein
MLAFAPDPGDSVLTVLSLPSKEVPIGDWLEENNWEEQRGSAKRFIVDGGALHMVNEDKTTVIGTRFKPKIDPETYPVIEFQARIDRIPPGADVTSKKKDDSAFRLFVIFDRGGGFFSPPETIGYVWDSTLKKGSTGRSARFKQVRYIVIGSGNEGLGEWGIYRRNIREDYKLLFENGNIPDISAVALKCDSNHTGSRSASSIRWIKFNEKIKDDADTEAIESIVE